MTMILRVRCIIPLRDHAADHLITAVIDNDAMADGTDTAIRKRNHLSRNAALLRLIESKGASLEERRSIECHFWAPTRRAANDLAEELRRRGFTTLRVNESNEAWNLEAVIAQSARVTASEQFTLDMMTAAEQFAAEYDGWGTSI